MGFGSLQRVYIELNFAREDFSMEIRQSAEDYLESILVLILKKARSPFY